MLSPARVQRSDTVPKIAQSILPFRDNRINSELARAYHEKQAFRRAFRGLFQPSCDRCDSYLESIFDNAIGQASFFCLPADAQNIQPTRGDVGDCD